MLVSCICVCHNKPDLTHEAIESILKQTYPDWEAIIVDSSVLYDAGYYERFGWRRDGRVKLIRSDETDLIRRTKAMAPWCYNECFRKGLVSGDLVMYLCDDDILYPNAFATFVSYCRRHADAMAMYAAQDVAVIYPNGWRAIVAERRATQPGGSACNGRRMDCHVDYLQFCHRTSLLGLFPDQEYWPESKDSERHADGVFMERIGAYTPIYPIDVKVSQNRRTLHSTYAPVGSLGLIECLANGGPLVPPQSGETARNDPDGVSDSTKEIPLVTISIATVDQGDGLMDTLASVAAQTYPNLDVLVLDNCSSDPEWRKLSEDPRLRSSHFRFLRQAPDRGLWEARGAYFITMDAGTLACSEMVERLVSEMCRHPKLSAMTCYLAAFRQTEAGRLLVSAKNLYTGGVFRTASLQAVGGYPSQRELPGQDWLGFFNLVNNGQQVGILPEHLFEHRPRDHGALEVHSFFQFDRLLVAERVSHWTIFAAMQQRLQELAEENKSLLQQKEALEARCAALRYQLADRLTTLCARVPFAKRSIAWLLRSTSSRCA